MAVFRFRRRGALAAAVVLITVPWIPLVEGYYVSYESPTRYQQGDRVPLFVNKLTSSTLLESWKVQQAPLFSSSEDSNPTLSSSTPTSSWNQAVAALHGDDVYQVLSSPDSFFDLRMKRDVICGQAALVYDKDKPISFADAIRQDLRYHFYVDALPVAVRTEDDAIISVTFGGSGVPMGRRGVAVDSYEVDADVGFVGAAPVSPDQNNNPRYANYTTDDLFVYNHWNFVIKYVTTTRDDEPTPAYQIVETIVQPFSIRHDFLPEPLLPVTFMGSVIPSCNATARRHTDYDDLAQHPPQRASADGNDPILFTYDVHWIETRSHDVNHRWNPFLNSSYGSSANLHLWTGVLIGLLINGLLIATLWTWIMRDFSYKPVATLDYEDGYDEHDDPVDSHPVEDDNRDSSAAGDEEEAEATNGTTNSSNTNPWGPDDALREVQMWPLSQKLFCRPRGRMAFCVLMGTGAQVLVASFVFVFLVQIGVVNQSMGAGQVTAALILYLLASLVGGYVTARLQTIFHASRRDCYKACAWTAVWLPLLSIPVLHLCYDVLPSNQAPDYNVLSHLVPVVLAWIFGGWPLTALGGWLGIRHGALRDFPVSEGTTGYQDLALSQERNNKSIDGDDQSTFCLWRCCRTQCCRILMLLLTGGILPLCCGFIEYAYAVAGPVYVHYYADYRFVLASFLLFTTCVAAVCALLFYRQIRASQGSNWWWPLYAAGASSGLYIFLLSLSWLLFSVARGDVTGATSAIYFLWFALISLGVALMTGFVGVAACILLTRELYADAMRRSNAE